ncbi:hypothetical protein ACVWWJ_002691 [Luteibacter sp. HA06]
MPTPTSPSTSHELWRALVEFRPIQVRRLLEMGASAKDAKFSYEVRFDGVIRDWPELTATALAVLVECDALEDDRRLGAKILHGPLCHAPDRKLWMVPLFKDRADWSGVHGAGGKSLMHFAREPDVARWLIANGAPCDVTDDEGKLPGDVLPPEVATIVDAHLLGAGLAAAHNATAAVRARL